ncbi:MAG: PDZ domain-containing protein [Thermoanaerobaculia bacterium]
MTGTHRFAFAAAVCLIAGSSFGAPPGLAQPLPAPAARPVVAARPALPAPALPSSTAVAPSPRPLTSGRAPEAPRAPRAPREPGRRDHGRTVGGYLGVELVDLTPELRKHFGVAGEAGVMIGRVEPESPAARAGLEVADIVTALGSEPVHDSWEFSNEIGGRDGGETLELSIVRDGRERQITATTERREREAVDVGRWVFPPLPQVPGVPPTPAIPPEMGQALARLGRLIDNGDLDARLRATQEKVDSEVKERMKALEQRLQELEKRLAEAGQRR